MRTVRRVEISQPDTGEERVKGKSVCIKISHQDHEIKFHKDEETGKHFRPGAGEGETKQ